MLYKSKYQSPLGTILALSNEKALLGLWFDDQKYYGANYQLEEASTEKNSIIALTEEWLDDYFSGEKPSITLPLAPEVTEFRKKVLRVLQQIPYGKTVTYKEIAEQLTAHNKEKTGSARAVGGAVGHNPISIIIPCHRVVGSDGSLTGYAGGVDRKIELLALEGFDRSKLLKQHI